MLVKQLRLRLERDLAWRFGTQRCLDWAERVERYASLRPRTCFGMQSSPRAKRMGVQDAFALVSYACNPPPYLNTKHV